MLTELISIIVPVYNIEAFLSMSIGSIQKQTYKNIEIIAVDDGSTDGSLAVLKKLAKKDDRIRVLHQNNSGVTKARLTGIEVANGEWIGFVDGDDYIEPDMYERLHCNAVRYKADISHCGYQMVFPDRVDYYYNTGRLICQNREKGLKDLLEGLFIEPGLCNKLFHKRLFQSLLCNKLIDYSIRNMEDLLINYYLFRESEKAVYEDICPYHYLVRKGSAATSKTNPHKYWDPLRVFRIIEEETKENAVLQRVIKVRVAGILIGISTLDRGGQIEQILSYRRQARKLLRRMLPELLIGRYSIRIKTLSFWAAVWPWSYGRVHLLYSKIRGTDKKFEV